MVHADTQLVRDNAIAEIAHSKWDRWDFQSQHLLSLTSTYMEEGLRALLTVAGWLASLGRLGKNLGQVSLRC